MAGVIQVSPRLLHGYHMVTIVITSLMENFDQSKKACEDLGANLTSLGSEEKTKFILER